MLRVAICDDEADEVKKIEGFMRAYEEAVSQLFLDKRFIRPHNSFMVNLDHVKSIQGSSLIMKNKTDIPIAHGAVGEMKEKYLHYFFRK